MGLEGLEADAFLAARMSGDDGPGSYPSEAGGSGVAAPDPLSGLKAESARVKGVDYAVGPEVNG
jgi:hypothetical protein